MELHPQVLPGLGVAVEEVREEAPRGGALEGQVVEEPQSPEGHPHRPPPVEKAGGAVEGEDVKGSVTPA